MKMKIMSFRAAALFLAGAWSLSSCEKSPTPAAAAARQLLLPAHGIYAGAYIEAGDTEDDVTLEKIDEFERLVGKHQAIVASSSYWGEQTFPDANVRLIARHGSVPLIFWSPWDRPYVEQGHLPDKYSLTSIIAGTHDAYIDMWANKARAFGEPIIVSFANEANGSWFPWSAGYYGAGDPAPGDTPEHRLFLGPETFKKAFRHVVDRVRGRGAKNVQFVLHLMNYPDPNDKWNLTECFYPGSEYCDWLGLSVYGSQFPADGDWAPFPPLLDYPYQVLCDLDPNKPIMLCEWGVAELPHLGNKAQWFREAFRLMQDPRYARLKAIVYWQERWENSEGDNAGKYSNLKVNSSPETLEAYRAGLASPFYLGEPQFAGGKK
jgi:hypothetical protein